MLETFGRTFLALGPPIVLALGTAITVMVAGSSSGSMRWWALGIGPALSLVVAGGAVFLVVELIDPAEGSGFLLGGAALGLYALATAVYYPGLLVVGLWRLWNR